MTKHQKTAEKSIDSTANGLNNAEKNPKNSAKKPKKSKNPGSTRGNNAMNNVELNDGLGTFTDKLKNLPPIIRYCIAIYMKPKKNDMLGMFYRQLDMAILTIISVISGALPNYRFFYHGYWYYAPLMTIVTAKAGIGKGIMDSIFELVHCIQNRYREQYHSLQNAWKQQQNELSTMSKSERKKAHVEILEEPAQILFRIPADITYASFKQILAVNNGFGELLDTEIDSVVNAFKSELGDYSVLLRKNFKHESHDYSRKTNSEYGEIPEPKFAMVLSGTISQMKNFVNEVVSGMFSRFCIYWNMTKPQWVDEEYYDDVPKDEKTFYREIGEKLLVLFEVLESKTNCVRFRLTKNQNEKFNQTFSQIHCNYLALEGDDIHSSVVRLAVIFHRIAMVFSISRLLDKDRDEMSKILDNDVVCLDCDFNNAMTMSLVLMEHASAYFEHIVSVDESAILDTKDENFDLGDEKVNEAVNGLPSGKELTTHEIIDAFVAKGIPNSTASKKLRKLLKIFVLEKVRHGIYKKSSKKDFLMKTEEAKKAKKAAKKAKK